MATLKVKDLIAVRDLRRSHELIEREPVAINADGMPFVGSDKLKPCCHRYCKGWGNLRPLLKLFPINDDKKYSILEFGESHYCQDHAITLKLSDIVSVDGWDQICEAFTTAGQKRPNRENVEILFKTIFEDLGLH